MIVVGVLKCSNHLDFKSATVKGFQWFDVVWRQNTSRQMRCQTPAMQVNPQANFAHQRSSIRLPLGRSFTCRHSRFEQAWKRREADTDRERKRERETAIVCVRASIRLFTSVVFTCRSKYTGYTSYIMFVQLRRQLLIHLRSSCLLISLHERVRSNIANFVWDCIARNIRDDKFVSVLLGEGVWQKLISKLSKFEPSMSDFFLAMASSSGARSLGWRQKCFHRED